MKYLLLAILLSGCCSLRHPLDGKAQSFCQAKPKGEKLCAKHGGLGSGWNPIYMNCKDGTVFGPDASKGE